MAEYIKREDVLRHRRKMSGADFGGEFWDEAVLCEDIRKIPTADVMEVVRCKDCIYAEEGTVTRPVLCNKIGIYNGKYDFCSYGERKDT